MQGQRKELLLQMLAESTDFLSGEKLAGELGISRAAVWKMIASLRQEGYCIEAVKKRGYLLQETDVLSAQQIRRALAKPWREIPIQVYDCIDSTNTQAKRQLSAGWRGEAILTAQEQTAGRGRRGRDFYSPRDKGIYMSLILQPQLRIEESLLITSAAAVAVCRALEGELGGELGIKWVNDIYRGGKKVCGILTEAITDFELGVVHQPAPTGIPGRFDAGGLARCGRGLAQPGHRRRGGGGVLVYADAAGKGLFAGIPPPVHPAGAGDLL